jgi:hypothetical protein
MGTEATCNVTFKNRTTTGRARLETDVLKFRGPELRLSIPFRQMTRVTSRGETLTVTFALGAASFDLGRAAAKWTDKIRHPRSRLDKLGVKPWWRASAIGVADRTFLKELQQ